jgi:hypothetical protein
MYNDTLPMMRALTHRSLHLRSLWAFVLVAMLGSSAWAKPKIAVLGIEAIGALDPTQTDVAKELTTAFRNRTSTGLYSLAANSKRELVDEKLMGNCANEALSCMAIISNNLAADFLLYGHLEKTNLKGVDGYQINLRLLKVTKTPTISGTLQDTHDEFRSAKEMTGPALTKWVDTTYIKMTGEKVEKPTGKLVIKVGNALVGTVLIDNDEKGQLEDGKLTLTLPEGSYKLTIEADGYKRYDEVGVEVRGGQSRQANVELVKKDEPPPPVTTKSNKRLFLGIGGAAALAVSATTGTFWILNFLKIRDYKADLADGKGARDTELTGPEMNKVHQILDDKICDATADQGATYMIDGKTPNPNSVAEATRRAHRFHDACKAQSQVYIDGVVTVGAALVGIGLIAYALVTKPSAEHNPTAGRRHKVKPEIALTPMVTPTTSGAILQISW